MNEEQSSLGQNVVETKPITQSPSQDFFRQKSNLLLISSLLILLGFFLPWVSVGGYSRYDRHNSIPTINGTFLLSNTGEIPGYSWLALLLLFSILAGSTIVAYNSYQKNLASIKTIIIGVSLATFIPVLVFFINFFASSNQELRGLGLGLGEGVSLGAGMIMMIAGSAYCLFFVVSEVLKNNRLINYRNLTKHGAIGAVVTAFALFMLLKFGNGSPGWMVFLYLAIFATGIIITNNIHDQTNGRTNYGRMITLGFIISVFTVIIQYILSNIFYSKEINQIPVQGSLLFVILILHIQLGLIITSISSARTTTTYIAPPVVSPVANTLAQPEQQTSVAVPPAVVTGSPFDMKKFIAKNKYIIFSLAGLIVLVIGVYYSFFKHYPVNDGKKAASAYCGCWKDQYELTTEGYKKFIAAFDSYKFSGREEAGKKLTELDQSNLAIYQQCYNESQEKLSKLKARYITDIEKTQKFENEYAANLAHCSINNDALSTLRNRATSKIDQYIGPVEKEQARQDSISAVAALRNAELAALAFDNATRNPPSIDKIQQDILGQNVNLPINSQFTSWLFGKIEDIKKITITGTTFQKDTYSCFANTEMQLYDRNIKENFSLSGLITYTWDFNTNNWVFQNIVAQEFHQLTK